MMILFEYMYIMKVMQNIINIFICVKNSYIYVGDLNKHV